MTDEELRAHLDERLASYKIPRSFERVTEPLRDDAGKVRRVGPGRGADGAGPTDDTAQGVRSRNVPRSRTTRSPTEARNTAPSAVRHTAMSRVSPGTTMLVKRADMLPKRSGSPPHTSCRRARPANPYVQSPCRIGRSSPADRANQGSECSGFRSPLSR